MNPRMPVASVRGPRGQDTVGTQEGEGVSNSLEDRNPPRCVSRPGISCFLSWMELSGSSSIHPSCRVSVCRVLSEMSWWVKAELVLPVQRGSW